MNSEHEHSVVFMYPPADVNINIIDSPVRMVIHPPNYISISALGKILTKQNKTKATSSSLLLQGDYNAKADYTNIKSCKPIT